MKVEVTIAMQERSQGISETRKFHRGDLVTRPQPAQGIGDDHSLSAVVAFVDLAADERLAGPGITTSMDPLPQPCGSIDR